MLSANAIALDNLKQSAGAQAAINKILLSILNGDETKYGSELSARSVNTSCEILPENWARCNHNILIHIDKIGSKPLIFSESRLDVLTQALDAADPILSVIESLTGFVLDPIEMVNAHPDKHAILEISRINEADRILIACPLEIQEISEFDQLLNSNLIDLSEASVEYDLFIKLSNLDLDDIADLSTDDLVILGNGAANTSVKWQGINGDQFTIHGIYDFISGEFVGDVAKIQESIIDGIENSDPASQGSKTLFPVSLLVCVKRLKAEAKKLAESQSGATIALGRLVPGTKVSIIFGQKDIFIGRLCQIGDHFAVSIDQKNYDPNLDIDNIPISKVDL